MTFGILRANAHPQIQKPSFQKTLEAYAFKGIFFDHKRYTPGLVIEQGPLVEFVRAYKKDPSDMLGHGLKTWEDIFASQISTHHILAFTFPHPSKEALIRKNYDPFEIYERRNQ